MSDLLIGGVPKRLVETDGAWTLEVLRQIAIDRSVYRPELRQIQGPDGILQYLRQDPQYARLAHSASDLLRRRGDDEQKRSYEAVNGEWVPSDFVTGYRKPLPDRTQATDAKSKLIAVQAECFRLRHLYTALSARIAHLEGLLEQVAEGGPIKIDRTKAVQTGAAVAQRTLDAPEAAVVVSETPKPSAATAKDIAPSGLHMPKAEEFVRCLEQLVGGDLTAKESSKSLEIDGHSHLYGAPLLDPAGQVVGGIAMDVTAVVNLGGTLLMIPESELRPMVAAGDASEDCLAASAELCNSFGNRVADEPANPQLKTEMLVPFDADSLGWMSRAETTLTLLDSAGGMTMIALK